MISDASIARRIAYHDADVFADGFSLFGRLRILLYGLHFHLLISAGFIVVYFSRRWKVCAHLPAGRFAVRH